MADCLTVLYQGMGVNSIQLQEIQTERHREMQAFNERLQLAQIQNTRNHAAAAAAAAKSKQKPPQRAAAITAAAISVRYGPYTLASSFVIIFFQASAAAQKAKRRVVQSSSESDEDDAPMSGRAQSHDLSSSTAAPSSAGWPKP
jgi:hypothetical protein